MIAAWWHGWVQLLQQTLQYFGKYWYLNFAAFIIVIGLVILVQYLLRKYG